ILLTSGDKGVCSIFCAAAAAVIAPRAKSRSIRGRDTQIKYQCLILHVRGILREISQKACYNEELCDLLPKPRACGNYKILIKVSIKVSWARSRGGASWRTQ